MKDSIELLRNKIRLDSTRYDFGTGENKEYIRLVEKAYGLKLPPDYFRFLENINGGMILEEPSSFYIDMLDDEPDGPKWSSFYFFSLNEMIDELRTFKLNNLLVGDSFEGLYPIIPICRIPIPEDGYLILISNRDLRIESPVFLFKPNLKKNNCPKIAKNFNAYLNRHIKAGGFPKPDITSGKQSFYEFARENRILELASIEDTKDSIGRLGSLIKLDPEDAWSFCERGSVYITEAKYPNAMNDFTKAIEIEPEEGFFYYCRGNLLLDLKYKRKALIDYDVAVKINADDKLSLSGRARAFLELGKLDKALYDCNKILAMDKTYELGLLIRIRVYNAMGKEELARIDSDFLDTIKMC
ncbi:MAG: hypothetical protein GXO88_10170 [Chlorobi bacterium]|nr:hypothetical protein [Chlorobiota bacterium]